MEELEIIEPKYEEINKEYKIKLKDNKLRIEINGDKIIFILKIGVSYYKYIKRYRIKIIITKNK